MPDRTLTIVIDSATLTTLKAAGYTLYGMVAVSSSNQSGRPLIALKTKSYLTSTSVTLEAACSVYDSTSPLAANQTVTVAVSCPIQPGQMATINTDGSISLSTLSGLPTTILIYNTSGNGLTVGLGRPVWTGSPTAATPVSGFNAGDGETVSLAPLDQLYLFFATSDYRLGTVLTTALGQGILVHLDQAPANASISYSQAGGGWSAGTATWADVYSPGTDLVQLLIVWPGSNVPNMAIFYIPDEG
ncbi:hypothetical protein [Oleisolibacter albus]|uniref:hypothetical protein n=1 Tax=Oleisolibacter albus TaxID=2171757 RepID=UPI000DF2E93A|nr:hypothetical protein [Oleisolibacter albus]